MTPRPLALALGLALVGCGASDQEQVTDAMHRFAHAVADGDAKTTCSLMTDRYRRTVGGASCEEGLNLKNNPLSAGQKQALRTLKVTRVTVKGDTARIETNLGREGQASFRRVDGKWLADSD